MLREISSYLLDVILDIHVCRRMSEQVSPGSHYSFARTWRVIRDPDTAHGNIPPSIKSFFCWILKDGAYNYALHARLLLG